MHELLLKPITRNIAIPTRLPSILLYTLAATFILCVFSIALLYGFFLINKSVSIYRRQMNAAAYDTQIFFDQREQLLRATAASAVSRINKSTTRDALSLPSMYGKINVYPLPDIGNINQWALALTARDVYDSSRINTTLVYTSRISGKTTPIAADEATQVFDISLQTEKWLANTLLNENPKIGTSGSSPLVWLNPQIDTNKRLFIYTPIDVNDIVSGWLGITFDDIDTTLEKTSLPGGSYIIYDPRGNPTLRGGSTPKLDRDLLSARHVDNFEITWQGGIPKYLVLSKSVGHAGWRIEYYMPFGQLLKDNSGRIYTALTICITFAVFLLIACYNMQRKILYPAKSDFVDLIKSVALLKNLLDKIPVGVALITPNSKKILPFNELAQAWLKTETSFKKIVKSACLEEEIKLKDGRVVHLFFTPIAYADQEATVCTIYDVTKIKQSEISLRNAMEAADAANQAKTLFLTTISHEIRTPLYGILGTLELLSLTGTSEQQRQYLDTLRHSSNILLSTLNDTLDLSRIEAGYMKLEQLPISPLELLDDIISTFCVRAERKNLRLYCTASANTPLMVLGDITRLRQILDNLVSNAIKFTASGHVVLRLHSTLVNDSKVQLKFDVADTGIGISEEHLPRLFEPYFRTDSDIDQSIQGTGLGLSICSRLSEIMGGELTATSELGIGSRISFKVTLPIHMESSQIEIPDLSSLTLYVRGAIPEVVRNYCEWLRNWGAMAIQHRENYSPVDKNAVLIEAWPWSKPLTDWPYRRIVTGPPGSSNDVSADRKTLLTDTQGILSLGRAIERIKHGQALEANTDQRSLDLINMSLLIVEDNPISQLILRDQLEHLGCTVEVATNGQIALDRKDIHFFDAIMTDLHMPVIDGYELASELRQRGYMRPIIGLTANAFPEEQRRGLTSGINVLLIKPLAIDELRKILKSIKIGVL